MFRDFYEAGFRIFPLWRFKNGQCECGNPECTALGKHPRASNWQHTPEWDVDQIDTMEAIGHFQGGYGVLCKGLLVIDVDARNGGVPSFEQLCDDAPEIRGADFIVETGSGGGSRHVYYAIPETIAMVSHLAEYPGIDFKSSGFVVGPGSRHASGGSYKALDGTPYDIGQAPAALIDKLRKPERYRTEYNGTALDVSNADIADMLRYVPNDDAHYDDWVKMGMAIHQATGGTGFDIWCEWSATSSKHDERDMQKRWHSFGKSANPVTIGTLIHLAEQGGWQRAVEFVGADDFAADADNIDPLDISGIDLLRPPGFCGDVVQWINDQCRYPRENLAVAAGLVAMGNVVGLRYTDDLDGVTANMFAFGVAGSATGKESVLQAVAGIHQAASISGATVGEIKAEQEIVKNLIRHQAAFYVMDEIGIKLAKIKNAQARGGAAYLEGVIGMLMQAYSKANGFMLLSGDVKEELRKSLIAEIAQHLKAVENNEDKTGARQRKADRLTVQVDTLDNGLNKPFISLVGFTTPETFDTLMDFEQATNGFVGRALLVTERETNPRPKKAFAKRAMPEPMARTLQTLYDGGEYDASKDRIEHYGARMAVRTDPKAAAALAAILDWIIDYAEQHKSSTGLEAVVRRGYEMVSKVSMILAAPSGVRTLEHVRWAFALVRRDVDEKMRLVISNDPTQGADKGLMARITKIISKDHGETFGVIKNRLRRYKPDDVRTALGKMTDAGHVRKHEERHPVNGKVSERWFLT